MTDARSNVKKDLNYYLSLPWTITFTRDPEEGGFVVRVEELRGCISQGDTFEEADEMIQDALRIWLEVALAHGDRIPEPGEAVAEYSGKFNVRVGRKLHAALVEAAEEDGVSLNHYVSTALAKDVGIKAEHKRAAAKVDAVLSDPNVDPDHARLVAMLRSHKFENANAECAMLLAAMTELKAGILAEATVTYAAALNQEIDKRREPGMQK